MIYKSKLEIPGIIVVWVFISAITMFIALSLDSIILAILFFIVGHVFLFLNLKRASFYKTHFDYGIAFFKNEHIDYSQINEITLRSSTNIRFESDPSLIVLFNKNLKIKKIQFAVKDDDKLIELLNYLYTQHSIKINVKSRLHSHINLKFER